MASVSQCMTSMGKLSLSAASRPTANIIPRFLAPSVSASQVRHASNPVKKKEKKKTYKTFKSYDLDDVDQYSLCDALRYLRAFEVGQEPTSVKYDVAIKLKTKKNGPIVRNNIRLPHPVKTDTKIAVVCPEDSAIAADAKALGAVAVGEQTLFNQIREGHIPFNKLVCHTSSEPALRAANLGKILGPKGLMPNLKMKTITNNVKGLMKELIGADEYRERNGVVRLAVGQLGFKPEQVADNVKTFVGQVTKECNAFEDETSKSVDEVVFSSTNGPGFSLTGGFNPTQPDLKVEDLRTPM